MPCLALAIPQLTVSHAQLLLAIPMKSLRAGPTMPIGAHDARDLPLHPVGHQHDPRFLVLLMTPEDDDAHFVLHVRDMHGAREVPLLALALPHGFADFRCD